MSTPTGPFARRLPTFVTGEPVYRPRQDGIGDGFVWLPFPLQWIVQAQDWMLWVGAVRVVMWYRVVWVLWAGYE